MKSSRAQAALNRERLIEVGSERFRERGYDGIGVADLMRELGQTHGAFYGNFASKEDFIAECTANGFERMLDGWREAGARISAETGVPLLEGLIVSYLSTAHRDHPGQGCMAAALGADAARHGPSVKATMSHGVSAIVDLLAASIPGATPRRRRERAVEIFTGMVGAMSIARAVDDDALSADILGIAARALRAKAGSKA